MKTTPICRDQFLFPQQQKMMLYFQALPSRVCHFVMDNLLKIYRRKVFTIIDWARCLPHRRDEAVKVFPSASGKDR